jgi:3-oxo-5-alpha-steroid 4-dehydrogenase 1
LAANEIADEKVTKAATVKVLTIFITGNPHLSGCMIASISDSSNKFIIKIISKFGFPKECTPSDNLKTTGTNLNLGSGGRMDTNNFIAQILVNHFIGTLAFILIGYFLSRLLKRNDIADILWGLGFLLIAVINFSLLNTPSFRAKVTLLLVMAWSLRLAFYLGIRNLSKSEEDPRYQNWRREWGSKEPINAFLRVFCLQGLLLFAISLPLGWAMNNEQRELSLIELVGVIIFSFGFIFELVADSELYFFKKLNRGKILDKGTWSLSRHPNYFGEILVWWGFFFIALPASKGLATLISPLMITFLLLKISGIPMLEKF